MLFLRSIEATWDLQAACKADQSHEEGVHCRRLGRRLEESSAGKQNENELTDPLVDGLLEDGSLVDDIKLAEAHWRCQVAWTSENG